MKSIQVAAAGGAAPALPPRPRAVLGRPLLAAEGNRLRAAPRQREGGRDAPVWGGSEGLSSWFECGQIFLYE